MGESEWSQAAWFETGLLEPRRLGRPRWIAPREPVLPPSGERPAYVLRTRFVLDSAPRDARLYATAHGVYETFLNGLPGRRLELAPGFTAYRANLARPDLRRRELCSRRREQLGGRAERRLVPRPDWATGSPPTTTATHVAFLGQLHVGDVVVAHRRGLGVGTGRHSSPPTSWRDRREDRPNCSRRVGTRSSCRRPRLRSSHVLARRRRRARSSSCGPLGAAARRASARSSTSARTSTAGSASPTSARPAPSSRWCTARRSTRAATSPRTISPMATTRWQHAAGRPDRPRGLRRPRRTTRSNRGTRRTASSTCGSRGTRTGSRPTTSPASWCTPTCGRTGWFRCSDERINRFHEIADWSFRDNACEIPTDCPQRERAGWTGDWQLFLPSAAFLYDVAGFSREVAARPRAEQRADGVHPQLRARSARPRRREWTRRLLDVPPGLVRLGRRDRHRAVGAVPGLRRPRRARRALAGDGRAGSTTPPAARERFAVPEPRATARPTPRRTRQYLWDTGSTGASGSSPVSSTSELLERRPGPRRRPRSSHHIRVARWRGSAGCSGTTTRPTRFEELAADALARVAHRVHRRRRTLTPDTQANHVRALAFGLVPRRAPRRGPPAASSS